MIPGFEKLLRGEFEHQGARVQATVVGEPVYEPVGERVPAPSHARSQKPEEWRTIHRIRVQFRAAFPGSDELPQTVIDALTQETKQTPGGHSLEARSGRDNAPHTFWFGFLDSQAALNSTGN